MIEEPEWAEVRHELNLPPDMDLTLLRRAFSHGSFVRESGLDPLESNQRLEFLGDAVLDLALAMKLYEQHPDLAEGQLTKMKSMLVRAEALETVARQKGLNRFLLLGRGEEEGGGRHKPSILADCTEALIGAIYLSCGWNAARHFVLQAFGALLERSRAGELAFDHKSRLQEYLQAAGYRPPTYRPVKVSGPEHDRTFAMEAVLNGHRIGLGEGPSKQQAEQSAALRALRTREEWLPEAPQADED
ncbi:MAG: ribonuclease III [Armatimonadota bacterium]